MKLGTNAKSTVVNGFTTFQVDILKIVMNRADTRIPQQRIAIIKSDIYGAYFRQKANMSQYFCRPQTNFDNIYNVSADVV